MNDMDFYVVTSVEITMIMTVMHGDDGNEVDDDDDDENEKEEQEHQSYGIRGERTGMT